MLKNTFQHIPSIGEKIERHLWNSGIICWDDYFKYTHTLKLPFTIQRNLEIFISKSIDALNNYDALFFEKFMPAKLLWRIYPEFSERSAFLDIETAGEKGKQEYITVITLYDGKTVKTFVKGVNLDCFPKEILNYSLIITYNGKLFDIPFILHTFKGLQLQSAHIDLRPLLPKLQIRGGLKSIEKQLGLHRPKFLKGIDGYHAIILWERFQKGDNRALNALIRYNQEDATSLHYIMHYAYNKMVKDYPINIKNLPLPKKPALMEVDPSIYYEVKKPIL